MKATKFVKVIAGAVMAAATADSIGKTGLEL